MLSHGNRPISLALRMNGVTWACNYLLFVSPYSICVTDRAEIFPPAVSSVLKLDRKDASPLFALGRNCYDECHLTLCMPGVCHTLCQQSFYCNEIFHRKKASVLKLILYFFFNICHRTPQRLGIEQTINRTNYSNDSEQHCSLMICWALRKVIIFVSFKVNLRLKDRKYGVTRLL